MAGSPNCVCMRSTSDCSIHPNTPAAWIASQAASLARILASLEKAPASPENAQDSGPSLPASFGYYDPDTHLLRTARSSPGADSAPSLAILPRWGTMRNGWLYQRPKSALCTSASASGYWPTPIATEWKNGCGKTGNRGAEKSAKAGWKLTEAVKMWPTPTARDWKDGSAEGCRNTPVNGLLGRAVHHPPSPGGGSLNPTWVEWLMGWPIEWTASRHWVTARSRSRQRSPGTSYNNAHAH